MITRSTAEVFPASRRTIAICNQIYCGLR